MNENSNIKVRPSLILSKPKIIAIGSSTGGSKALELLFQELKGRKVNVPIMVTQHIPMNFSDSLVEQISAATDINCQIGEDGIEAKAGTIYIAPGGKHMLLSQQDKKFIIKLDDGPQVNFCKPAVDPMIRSIIDVCGRNVCAIILTGMGSDGLNACTELSKEGGMVLAQDEETSTVWGMPGAVAKAGICNAVLPIPKIADYLIKNTFGALI